MKEMRAAIVIHVISGLNQGGAEAMLEKIVHTGSRLDSDIEQRVISLTSRGPVAERMRAAGVQVECLHLEACARALFGLWRLLRLLRPRGQRLIVQTWLWHADLIGGLCARAVGNRRVIWNLRNSMPSHTATRRSSRAVARICAVLSRWVPSTIVCNSTAAQVAHVGIGYQSDKCMVIPNGFDTGRFARCERARRAVRAEWSLADDELVVGMVARVDALKDHATLIRAAALLARRVPGVRLVLVGDGITRDPQIRSLLGQLPEVRAILQERRDDVWNIMSALDIFCLASHSEGFPNVLGEAMACEVPCVATDVGAARDILGDDRLLAPVHDPAALAGRIESLLRLGAGERRALGARLRERVVSRFDIEQVWKQYRAIYLAV